MNLKEALTKMLKRGHHSFASLAEELDYKSAASIGNPIMRGDMRVSMLFSICKKLGYEIVLRPTRGDDKAENTFVLDENICVDDGRGKFKRPPRNDVERSEMGSD